MIDIHNHLIPNFDDGSDSLELSLELLKQASLEGITDAICTPHYIEGSKFQENPQTKFEAFKQVVNQQLNINLHLGQEIYIKQNTDDLLKEKKLYTLAGTNYILIELPWDKYSPQIDEYLYNISLLDYKIIIAHPERYDYIKEDYKLCINWLKNGYYLQMNQNSLFKKDLRKNCKHMLDHNFIQFIASDAHGMHRPCTLKDAYKDIENNYGKQIADDLFTNNQRKLLHNQDIEIAYTQPKKRLFSFK